MDYYELQANTLLAEHKAVLIRRGHHLVYKIPNKGIFSVAKTPSENRSSKNNLAILRRLLGISSQSTAKPEPKVKAKTKVRKTAAKSLPKAELKAAPARRTLRTELQHALDPYLIPAGTPLPELPTPAKYHKEREHRQVAAAYAPTPEVLAEANRILASAGEKAMHDFLNHHRTEFTLATKRPKKEQEPMSKLDLTLEAAQRQIISIDRAIKEAEDRKQHAETVAMQASTAIATYQQQRKDCMEYIASYELATQQAELVEKIVPVMMPTNGHHKRTPNAGATVMSVCNEMLESRSKVSAAELVDACKKKGVEVKKGTVYTTLAYHAAKENPSLEKVGTAIYARKSTNGMAATA